MSWKLVFKGLLISSVAKQMLAKVEVNVSQIRQPKDC